MNQREPKTARARGVSEAVRARRSIKTFEPDAVQPKQIEKLLDLAVTAPNHRMTQPFEFVVLGPEARRAFGEIKGRRRASKVDDSDASEAVRRKTVDESVSVPAMIGFIQRLDDDPEIREEDFATIYMAIESVLLAAIDLDLGTHVKTGAILEASETRDALGIGEGERLVALVNLGVPAAEPASRHRVSAADRTRWIP